MLSCHNEHVPTLDAWLLDRSPDEPLEKVEMPPLALQHKSYFRLDGLQAKVKEFLLDDLYVSNEVRLCALIERYCK